jgi:chromosome segregation ATPase
MQYTSRSHHHSYEAAASWFEQPQHANALPLRTQLWNLLRQNDSMANDLATLRHKCARQAKTLMYRDATICSMRGDYVKYTEAEAKLKADEKLHVEQQKEAKLKADMKLHVEQQKEVESLNKEVSRLWVAEDKREAEVAELKSQLGASGDKIANQARMLCAARKQIASLRTEVSDLGKEVSYQEEEYKVLTYFIDDKLHKDISTDPRFLELTAELVAKDVELQKSRDYFRSCQKEWLDKFNEAGIDVVATQED